jgi:ubiquinone/menaquinone biosynthesis C-methylase UbiE
LGFYERRVLPRLIDFAMSSRRLTRLREQVVGEARGRVLEVGIGSGLNLPFYRRDLESLVAVDPSPALLAMARPHTAWVHFPVSLREASAEALPLEDGTVDTVVMTWTLCSVAVPEQALGEIRRVLRPGGALLFIEHGRARQGGIAAWQDRLTPLWRKVAGGCHLNRPVDRLIAGAGLRLAALEVGYLVAGPRPFTFHYRGRAAK